MGCDTRQRKRADVSFLKEAKREGSKKDGSKQAELGSVHGLLYIDQEASVRALHMHCFTR